MSQSPRSAARGAIIELVKWVSLAVALVCPLAVTAGGCYWFTDAQRNVRADFGL